MVAIAPPHRSRLGARFRRCVSRSIPQLIGRDIPPTLCVSDTHLVPRETWYADDAPGALLQLLRAFADHHVVVLGDFIESLVLSDEEAAKLARSDRLAPIFGALRRREARVLLGNHDIRVRRALSRALGTGAVVDGPIRLGPMVLLHGHEAEPDMSMAARALGRVAVPVLVTLKRAGIEWFGPSNNEALVTRYRGGPNGADR
jgi:hypothetical protein